MILFSTSLSNSGLNTASQIAAISGPMTESRSASPGHRSSSAFGFPLPALNSASEAHALHNPGRTQWHAPAGVRHALKSSHPHSSQVIASPSLLTLLPPVSRPHDL